MQIDIIAIGHDIFAILQIKSKRAHDGPFEINHIKTELQVDIELRATAHVMCVKVIIC